MFYVRNRSIAWAAFSNVGVPSTFTDATLVNSKMHNEIVQEYMQTVEFDIVNWTIYESCILDEKWTSILQKVTRRKILLENYFHLFHSNDDLESFFLEMKAKKWKSYLYESRNLAQTSSWVSSGSPWNLGIS
jgi:hypothetical protein